MTARLLIAVGFALVFAVAVVVDIRARRPESAVRPFGDVLAVALRTRTGRIVVFVIWLWLGWHFLAR